MKLADSREKGGPGFLPLQAHREKGPTWDLDKRPAMIGWRMVNRLDGIDQLGHWVYDEKTVGDLNGGQYWEEVEGKRPIPMWRFSTPVIMDAPTSGAVPTGMKKKFQPVATGDITEKGVCKTLPSSHMLPVWTHDYAKDDRFKAVEVNLPEVWPKFPRGFYGISLVGDDETEQVDYFMPVDPRMIAVQREGDARMGSLVCDMDTGFRIDPTREAPLQSHFKVVKKPTGCVDFFGGNSIALSVRDSGCQDTRGGLIWDRDVHSKDAIIEIDPPSIPTGGVGSPVSSPSNPTVVTPGTNGVPVLGMLSQNQSGVLDSGGSGCQHQIGVDDDGTPIYSTHISTQAYFKRPATQEDGPIDFTVHLPGADAEVVVPVYIGFAEGEHPFVCGKRTGLWKMWTTTKIYTPRVPPGVPDMPIPPIPPFNGGTPTGGGNGGGTPTEGKTLSGNSPLTNLNKIKIPGDEDVNLPYTASYQEFGSVAANFRAIQWTTGQIDYRYEEHPGDNGLSNLNASHPITLRADVWSKQLGNQFNYTVKPQKGKYVGGSSDGGMIYLPPEVGMEMINNTTPLEPEQTNKPVSTSHVTVGPGARFAAGIPDLSGGGIERGYSWWEDGSGGLNFATNASSTATDRVKFDVNGSVGIGGESFGGALGSVVFIANASRSPVSNPSGGGILYVESGALKYRGSGGTVTTLASA